MIADVDRGLWNLYNECSVTPQMWIVDEGGVLIDDACTGEPGSLDCLIFAPCGEQKQRSRDVLESILPAQWCGEAQQ